MFVTEPRSVPSRSATCVSGQRKPFAANSTLSPATTAAAIAVRRSDRFVKPVQSTYTMQDSIENQVSVCKSRITVSVALGRRAVRRWPDVMIGCVRWSRGT